MTSLPAFEYHAPASLGAATDLLAELGPATRLIAGGTDLLPAVKRGQLAPRHLVSLAGVPDLVGVRPAVEPDDGGLVIGAMTRLTGLAGDARVQRGWPVVSDAVGLIATPALRNMGTLGGNLCLDTRCTFFNRSEFWREAVGYCLKLDGDACQVAPGGGRCWAAVSSDLAPVMVALGATARLVSAAGERSVAVEDLYRDDGLAHLTLQPGEVLAEVRLPPLAGAGASYLKLRPRAAFDFPSLGVAVVLRMADGLCTHVRIAVGAVASRPVRATAAEALLHGQAPTDELLRAAAEAVQQAVRPVDNADLPPGYRRQVARVFTARALRQALGWAPATAHGPSGP